mmetsp:Transcript_15788/g.34579  ORF Transcript_15788/g.34579 Transcript_15788/m.34579 type:complete len:253 (+) Transcript_15788:119-877(+)
MMRSAHLTKKREQQKMSVIDALQGNNNAVLLLQSGVEHHRLGAATLKRSMMMLETEFLHAPSVLVQSQQRRNYDVEIALAEGDASHSDSNIVSRFFLFHVVGSGQGAGRNFTGTPNETSTATYLAVSLYNLALHRQLQYGRSQMPERVLHGTAVLYKSAFRLLTAVAQVNGQDSAAVVALAACTNLHALYLDLGDLRQAHEWKNQLTRHGATQSILYHQAKSQEAQDVNADESLRVVLLTASAHGFIAAGAA